MGVQSAPASGTIINTTLQVATTTGGAVLALPIAAGPYPIGTVLSVDTAANQENVTIAALSYSTNSGVASVSVSATTKNHAAAVAVTGLTTTAKISQMTFATAGASLGMLPSYTLQFQRVIDAIIYSGCCVDTMKLSQESGKYMQADFGLVGCQELVIAIGSAAAPSFSVRQPFQMEAAESEVYYKGLAYGSPEIASGATPAVLKWELSVNNNLNKAYRSTQTGRYVAGFPVGSRAVSGAVTMGFESNAAYEDWLGSTGATSPQQLVLGVPLHIASASNELADAANSVNYQMIMTLPLCFPTQDPVPGKVSGELQQTFAFDSAEQAGAGNDLTITYICLTSSAFA